MIRRLLLSALLAGSMMTSGCYMLNMEVNSSQPVLVNASAAPGKTRFQHEERVLYFLWGLVNTNPSVVDNMTRQYANKRITGFNVYTEQDAVAIVTGVLTLGIVSSRVVRVEGNQ